MKKYESTKWQNHLIAPGENWNKMLNIILNTNKKVATRSAVMDMRGQIFTSFTNTANDQAA